MAGVDNITIYDIAQEAGVSPATVSRVLTKKARVSDRKRIAVEALIQKYKFQPNVQARSLSDMHTRALGLMVADICNPYYATLVVECEKAANRRGYTILLCNILNNKELENANLEKLYAQRVDAIIQMGCRTDDLVSDPDYVMRVNRISRKIPFITTGKLDGTDCYCLNINQAEAMRLVFEYLVAYGHREIALIGGKKQDRASYQRWQQYIYLMGVNHLPFREEYVQESGFTADDGYACLQRLLHSSRLPTAVIARNDYCAVGALRAAHEHGISIPGDLSLISFDNTFLSEIVTPRLTSIDYNYAALGNALVDLAISLAETGDAPKNNLINPLLIVRDSCAPAVHA
ncbi:MAG: LacI family transcriptional regulator [Treponema sp.]|jgi:DNA-binding LacI/PurR family transcriptional regulator|nr:LacI family transcriptional regulator [Treponema sp.]